MEEDTAAAYDRVADDYQAAFPSLAFRRREYHFLFSHVPPSWEAVLDVGCGNGIFLKTIAASIGRGIGVDVSPRMLHLAAQNTRDCRNVRILNYNGIQLPFPDRTFDCVLSSFSWRYFPLEHILSECHRVLKDEGTLLVVDQFLYGATRPSLWSVAAGKARFLWSCLRRPKFPVRLQALISKPEWRHLMRRFPGTTIEDFTRTCAACFHLQRVKRLNCSFQRVTYGILAAKRGVV
ncbi:MAG TPA: class I SAM-dependent methyltransferase [Spirochaetia bacterium]|nr:class I SAM-dependent methyltransferase [Spirochaetia bacterium]